MEIVFLKEEIDFIVNDEKTDLLLTSIGLKLVELSNKNKTEATLKTNKHEYNEFIETLRNDYIWKTNRIKNTLLLCQLAKRFLHDFNNIETKF